MQPISGFVPGAVQSPAAVSSVKEVPKVQRPEGEGQGRPLKPVMEEYIPEEKQEPSGRYWLGKDADGQPKIYFDDPNRAAESKTNSPVPIARIRTGKQMPQERKLPKAETCTCNTDAVDREIENLKKKREELECQINSETDDAKIKELEKKLAQVESELRQKDTDAYRRQHSTFS